MDRPTLLSFSAALLGVAACGGAARGALVVTIYGEDFVEEGIAADEFADDWEVVFDRFLISVGEVSASAGHREPGLVDDTYRIFDLARSSGGAGFPVLRAEVAGGTYDHLAFRIGPSAAPVAGNATAEDTALMREGGFSLFVEGVAVRGDEVKSFAWGFDSDTSYGDCHSAASVDGGEASVEITIHADHLFYDDLVSSEPDLRFDLIARADSDGDGDITADELAAIDITGEDRYQVGNATEVRDLWTFIDRQTSTLGHVEGEGHCESAVRR